MTKAAEGSAGAAPRARGARAQADRLAAGHPGQRLPSRSSMASSRASRSRGCCLSHRRCRRKNGIACARTCWTIASGTRGRWSKS